MNPIQVDLRNGVTSKALLLLKMNYPEATCAMFLFDPQAEETIPVLSL
jgi:hypothetical protein